VGYLKHKRIYFLIAAAVIFFGGKMKSTYSATISVVSVLSFALSANASLVSIDSAIAVADMWMSASSNVMQQEMLASPQLSIKNVDGIPAFYSVNYPDQGWVLISADKRIRPVLAHSDDPQSNLDLECDAVRLLIESWSEQVKEIRSNDNLLDNESWSDFDPAEADNGIRALEVAPLIPTEWGQNQLYNQYCPEDLEGPAGYAYAGCVAVAMAQVMNYWQYPAEGFGSVSYSSLNYGIIEADFSQAQYDWSSMANDEATEANAELIYHCGVATRVNYSPSNSTTSTGFVAMALPQYFGYVAGLDDMWRYNYDDESWKELIVDELIAGRPVVYRGQGGPGHCFLVDGVQNSDYFHINWGWNGSANGYFFLDDLTPGSGNFSNWQAMIIGITPGEGYEHNTAPTVSDFSYFANAGDLEEIHLRAIDSENDELTFFVNGDVISGNTFNFQVPEDFSADSLLTFMAYDGEFVSNVGQLTISLWNTNGGVDTRSSVDSHEAISSNDNDIVEEIDGQVPVNIQLKQNYPNPFNPTTTIEFSLEESAQVLLCVYNSLGQEVSRLVDQHMSFGNHNVSFDGSALNSGVYYYSIQSSDEISIKKMLLVK
jgi:hypothetical protein